MNPEAIRIDLSYSLATQNPSLAIPCVCEPLGPSILDSPLFPVLISIFTYVVSRPLIGLLFEWAIRTYMDA